MVPLEVGKEVAGEVPQDRALEVEAQMHEVIEIESEGEEVAQVADEERINA